MSSTVLPSATSERIVSHIWPRVRGSRPVVGSSRKISGGRRIRLAARSRRRRMPPEKVAICRSAASSRPNCPISVVARSLRVRPRQAEQPAEQPEVLGGGQVLVDRGVLPGDADQLPHLVRLPQHVDPEDLRLSGVDPQQGRQHAQHRGLAGPVRAEHTEDLSSAYLQVNAVHRAGVAELLDESRGGDGQVVVCGHAEERGSGRFQGSFTGGPRGFTAPVVVAIRWSSSERQLSYAARLATPIGVRVTGGRPASAVWGRM